MKKKVTLLAALAMAVTVGGVYATWEYTQGAATTTETDMSLELSGVEVDTATSIGKIIAKANGGVRLDDGGNYVATVVLEESTYFTITLSDLAAGVDLNEVELKYTLTVLGVPSFDGTVDNILSINKTGTIKGNEMTEVSTGVYSTNNITISASDFTWSQELVLDTYADYVEYRDTKFSGSTIRITVEDVSTYN